MMPGDDTTRGGPPGVDPQINLDVSGAGVNQPSEDANPGVNGNNSFEVINRPTSFAEGFDTNPWVGPDIFAYPGGMLT